MRIAITDSEGRVSPVFDVTDNLCVIDVQGKTEVGRERRTLVSRDPFLRAREVSEIGVGLLVCGALSHMLEMALIREGIEVAGFICGDVDAVVDAFLNGRTDGSFLMPGCRRRRRGFRTGGHRGGHRWGRKE
jgi:predicted Fe-Mo cluster-binding NifX family protein